jgi:hypothetical protein
MDYWNELGTGHPVGTWENLIVSASFSIDAPTSCILCMYFNSMKDINISLDSQNSISKPKFDALSNGTE